MPDIKPIPWGPDLPESHLRRAALNTVTKLREQGWDNRSIRDTLGALGLIDKDVAFPPGPLKGLPIPVWP